MYLQRDTQFLLNDEITNAMPSIYTTQEAESQSDPAQITFPEKSTNDFWVV